MNYVIQARKHPPSNLTASLYTKRLARGRLWAELFQFDAVEIISSFVQVYTYASVILNILINLLLIYVKSEDW